MTRSRWRVVITVESDLTTGELDAKELAADAGAAVDAKLDYATVVGPVRVLGEDVDPSEPLARTGRHR